MGRYWNKKPRPENQTTTKAKAGGELKNTAFIVNGKIRVFTQNFSFSSGRSLIQRAKFLVDQLRCDISRVEQYLPAIINSKQVRSIGEGVQYGFFSNYRTPFFMDSVKTPISAIYCSPLNFLPRASSKLIYIELFSTFFQLKAV